MSVRKRSVVLQKLFSAFPNGLPGVGLLLLRAFVSVLIALTVFDTAHASAGPVAWVVAGVSFAIAVCLLAGFMTPLIAATIVTGGIVLAVSNTVPVRLEVIILAVVIALLGPGAFSLDARMFGRREILVPNTSRSSKS